MRMFLAAACLVLCTGQVALADTSAGGTPAANSQQQRMKDCNAQAKTQSLKGDARKTFMSSCLKGDTAAAPAATTPQQRMKDCNAQATSQGLKGDARKTFMSTCLKKS